MSRIAVVGTGYVGLTTGVCFAHLGHEVVCGDVDAAKIARLQRGDAPIVEPGIEDLLAESLRTGRLRFVVGAAAAVAAGECEFAVLCVPTPPAPDGGADLSYIEAAAREISPALAPGAVVVNKSTVPVGTGEFVREVIERHQGQPVPFDVVSNPEFLREGSAIEDTLRPDRIVIGAPTQQVAMTLLELYAPLERPMIITDVPSAEMIKYASNAFLATKISFINAIANICELAGADVTQVMKGMGLDARIGAAFLQAGLGYGGSCFPKDTDSLVHTAATLGYRFDILRAVVDVNAGRSGHFVSMIERALTPLPTRRIAVLGLAFKPNTDDMREAKSVEVISRLVELGATVCAYDPVAMTHARKMLPTVVEYAESPYAAATGADGVALITEWNEFKFLNLERLRTVMRRPAVFDGRNLWEAERMRRLGFEYYSIGRKPIRRT